MRRSIPLTANRRGLSLMEVILALAVFGVALAVIGELLRMGSRASGMARDLATAQLLAESKMAEIAAGIVPTQTSALASFELTPDWLYAVEVGSTEQPGLLTVRVSVEQNIDPSNRPVTFSLVRWVQDPAYVITDDSATTDAAQTSSPTEGSGG